ncbi:hypothetical protein A3G67_02070 [Candidatus Roizmanbacteria bacterium RIFCSPLOWO2_12_FULL_40_12]|uniref:Inositol monophosphatase n=1 Tax=Candidatus Roizmanbacteria bacterium RIFCSPLOWO2_01_FULL_40_42 TaxID=1802066 RepID=A0A1F7J3Q0_9BACT|nr:MAG: hypothetical protein A2779_01190 [Candidatus Roizmanbacteria bacterium RIFCSPHIGHO2_01_FULL_40_98]OGK28980.1 MAG: hypothetical protein A3C31_01830 [Candidatus Roizmanbacteria bacterium RIFCSPHIGHO2_02_FULL_40_53]OGK29554.1 MAG: hypothetical protein A2W49_03710 [Candidatus Roizmanbacteria bacterium RIFCSPHIGHO2_12_41_18]OGK37267.1 MAG: hypothetical protein A3E69_04130 [Candidatus Roizmanbacteria bacterium RIFCSPHIGHO2_12_FULL_40_130]OGK50209.1 MAG: hypothetical protein A3B50_00285 [Candi
MKNNYKSFAIDLAYKAGALIKTNFYLGSKRTWKKDNTPVTETDFAVNKLVLDAVRKTYPDFGVLAEEESAMKDNAEYVWVCDPIDGTVPFSHGIPTFVFQLALVKDGKPILGVVYDPILDRLFTAEKGKGSFLNDNRIRVSQAKTFDKTLFFGIMGKHSKYYMRDVLHVITEKGANPINFRSIGYGGMLVAAGEIAGAAYSLKSAHDVAPLKILIEEAGGKVTDMFGNEQRYDREIKGALLTNGILHDELLQIIKENVILR